MRDLPSSTAIWVAVGLDVHGHEVAADGPALALLAPALVQRLLVELDRRVVGDGRDGLHLGAAAALALAAAGAVALPAGPGRHRTGRRPGPPLAALAALAAATGAAAAASAARRRRRAEELVPSPGRRRPSRRRSASSAGAGRESPIWGLESPIWGLRTRAASAASAEGLFSRWRSGSSGWRSPLGGAGVAAVAVGRRRRRRARRRRGGAGCGCGRRGSRGGGACCSPSRRSPSPSRSVSAGVGASPAQAGLRWSAEPVLRLAGRSGPAGGRVWAWGDPLRPYRSWVRSLSHDARAVASCDVDVASDGPARGSIRAPSISVHWCVLRTRPSSQPGSRSGEQLAHPQPAGLGGQVGVQLRAGVGRSDDGEVEHVGADVVGDVLALALAGDDELVGAEHPLDGRGDPSGAAPRTSMSHSQLTTACWSESVEVGMTPMPVTSRPTGRASVMRAGSRSRSCGGGQVRRGVVEVDVDELGHATRARWRGPGRSAAWGAGEKPCE